MAKDKLTLLEEMAAEAERERKAAEARIDKMGRWATDAGKRIKLLETTMITTVEENADALGYQLAALVDGYDGSSKEYASEQASRATASEAARNLKEDISDMEAPVYLEVSAELTDAGKAKYGNDGLRAAAVSVHFAKDENYAAIKTELRNARQAESMSKARLASIERDIKTWGRKVDALRSRLDNLTARAGGAR